MMASSLSRSSGTKMWFGVAFVLFNSITTTVQAKQCHANTPAEFRDAFYDHERCTGIKLTDFVLTNDALDKTIFKTPIGSNPSAPSAVGMRSFECLVFSGTKFESGAILMLSEAMSAGLFKTKSLIFWNNGLDSTESETSEALAALVQILEHAHELEELRFSDNLLFDNGATELGNALADSSVQKVVLSGNGIAPDGIASMAMALARSQNLTQLTISGAEGGKNSWMSNHVGEAGAQGIGILLNSRSRMQRLVLAGSGLQDEGATVIGGAISGHPGLQILDLNRNAITDIGAKAVAEGLKKAAALKLLIMSTNKITDVGSIALAFAARANPKVRVIDLDHNSKITHKGKKAVQIALTTKFASSPEANVHDEF